MKTFSRIVKNFVREEEGANMIEYVLIGALISVVAVVALGLVGEQVDTVFGTIKDELQGAN